MAKPARGSWAGNNTTQQSEEYHVYRDKNPFVHQGQILHDRYRLIYHLGYDSTGVFWLCHDRSDADAPWKLITTIESDNKDGVERLEAVINLARENSQNGIAEHRNICLPVDHFLLTGPHGMRLCLVTELMGPNMSDMARDDPESIRSICFQVCKGLQYLHDRGLRHGNLRPSSIHLQVSEEIQAITESEMQRILDATTTRQKNSEDYGGGIEWPRELQHLLIPDKVCVVGLEPLSCASNRTQMTGGAIRYASPELLLGIEHTLAADTWSLACTFAEIRTGQSLFGERCRSKASMVAGYERYLGPLPEPHRAVWEKVPVIDRERMDDDTVESALPNEFEEDCAANSIYSAIAREVPASKQDLPNQYDCERTQNIGCRLSKAEVLIFGDLLCRTLKYDVEERLTISEIMEHSWFSSRFRRSAPIQVNQATTIPPSADDHTQATVNDNNQKVRRRLTVMQKKGSSKPDTNNYQAVRLRHTKTIRSGHSSKFDLMNSGIGGFILGLAMATVFWTLLIIAKLKPVTSQTPNAMVVERIANSIFGI
ncbi:hypothetical protein E8E14_002793 [Neopestalotiopsis sp. 37M]|nr:hypothetical protein E8E14_002793 [Neopestalotiopsis sp. 37M]